MKNLLNATLQLIKEIDSPLNANMEYTNLTPTWEQ